MSLANEIEKDRSRLVAEGGRKLLGYLEARRDRARAQKKDELRTALYSMACFEQQNQNIRVSEAETKLQMTTTTADIPLAEEIIRESQGIAQ
jgi:hypothetical protein